MCVTSTPLLFSSLWFPCHLLWANPLLKRMPSWYKYSCWNSAIAQTIPVVRSRSGYWAAVHWNPHRSATPPRYTATQPARVEFKHQRCWERIGRGTEKKVSIWPFPLLKNCLLSGNNWNTISISVFVQFAGTPAGLNSRAQVRLNVSKLWKVFTILAKRPWRHQKLDVEAGQLSKSTQTQAC